MKRWLFIMTTVLAAGCPSTEVESGMAVTLEFDSGLTSKCVQLVARVPGSERRSGPVVLKGMPSALVAVARGDLPEVITLQALGFSDAQCSTLTVPAENSPSVEARFVRNVKATRVTLRVRRDATATAEDCANGVDDDGDGLADCADEVCDAKPCSTGDACLVEQLCTNGLCSGGSMKQCTSPPTACFASSGSCASPGGDCVYAPRADAGCDDINPCTTDDRCDPSGQCQGVTKVCNAPPTQCFASTGTCAPDGACTYTLTEGAVCNDGQACTIADRCAADGGCAGIQVLCPQKECLALSGSCADDGGCQYVPLDAGVSCTGGLCNATGSCQQPFSYVPSNFTLQQVPNVPATGTVLNCGVTTIDTSSTTPQFTNWCGTTTPEIGWAIISQTGEQSAMLFSFKSLNIGTSGSLVFKGTKSPILVIAGDAHIDGPLRTEAGARSCAVGAGKDGKVSGSGNGGGGGGGFGSTGGSGASGSPGASAAGGPGGDLNADPLLVPLRGGCSGGLGGRNMQPVALGGGALQLSVGGSLTVSSAINAPGQGGAGGAGSPLEVIAGHGAGSGGALLLEAFSITLTGGASLTANGGGGGQAGDAITPGASGASGGVTTTGALGGTGGSSSGRGGNGATATVTAENGTAYSGGGGGGYGRIRLNTTSGCLIDGSAVLSPQPTARQADGGCL